MGYIISVIMKTKTELLKEFQDAVADMNSFVETAQLNGGMHFEARLKLLENRMDDMYWFIGQLLQCLPDDEQ